MNKKDTKKSPDGTQDQQGQSIKSLQSTLNMKRGGGGVASSLLANAGIGRQAAPPQTVEQRFMLAQSLHRAGNLDQAEAHYKSVIKTSPQNAKALALFGMLLKQKEQWTEAYRMLKKSLRLNPREAEAHNGLGMVQRHMGKYHDAIASFKKASELDPGHPGPINNMGIVYREIGEFENAAQCFEDALAIDPNIPEAWHGLAQTRKNTGDRNAIEHLRKIVDTANLDPGAKRHAAFALGKFCDAAGQYDDAFHYFSLAKSDRRNPDAWKDDCDLIKEIASVYTRDMFASLQTAKIREEDPVPIMVLGMPRSGTTLAEQILASHPLVDGGGELQFFRERTRKRKKENIIRFPDYPQNMTAVDGDILTRVRRDFFKEFNIKKSKVNKTGDYFVVDKTPFNFLYLGLITGVLPEVKVVHCRRNHMDTILSIYFTDFSTNFPYTEDLMAIGREYVAYLKLMAHWRDALPVPIFDLQYEGLINDQEKVTRDLVAFCGMSWDDRCLTYHETKRQVSTPSDWQVRQPIYSGSVERWRNYEQHLKPVADMLRAEGVIE